MIIARFATIFIIRVFGTHLWRSLWVLRLFMFFRSVVFELVHAFARSHDWSFPLLMIELLVCQLRFGSSFSSGRFIFLDLHLLCLFKNTFLQRCCKIKMSPLLHILVVCFFFLFVSYCSPLLLTDIFKEGIWKETETFQDPYLQSLTSMLQTLFCQQELGPPQICII